MNAKTEQNSTHTPGKWEYGVRRDGSIWLSLGSPINGPHYQGDLVASEADARLIAAAPDILAAGKAILNYATLGSTLAGDRSDDAVFGIRIGDLRVLAAAIAKAVQS